MRIRRIATGYKNGKPTVAIDERVEGATSPGTGTIWRMWSSDTHMSYPGDGRETGSHLAAYPPPPGFRFHAFEIPPAAEMIPESVKDDPTGVSSVFEDDGTGMHETDTTDCLVLLSGRIQLELEGGEKTIINAGDFIVQNGTKHKWVNVGDTPALIAAFIIGANRR